jgi:hypothetical protein
MLASHVRWSSSKRLQSGQRKTASVLTICEDIRGLSGTRAEGRRLERQEAEGPQTTWELLTGRLRSGMIKWASLEFQCRET